MKASNQSGQSTIEFIFCFIFAVSLILLVFNTSLNYAAGYVTHYATFMASRTMLTQDPNDANGAMPDMGIYENKARETFNKYNLSVFGISNSAMSVTDAARNPNTSSGEYLTVGVYAKFDRKMDLVGQITGNSALTLISESFLGREPTRQVCATRVCYAITGNVDCAQLDITLYDDGC